MPNKQISFNPKKHNLITFFKALIYLKSSLTSPLSMVFGDVGLLEGMKEMGPSLSSVTGEPS